MKFAKGKSMVILIMYKFTNKVINIGIDYRRSDITDIDYRRSIYYLTL